MLADPTERRGVGIELLLVLTVTLGLAGVRSLLSLVDSLLAAAPLTAQTAVINAPVRRAELLDLAYQLTGIAQLLAWGGFCLLYTSPSPRDRTRSRMPSSA